MKAVCWVGTHKVKVEEVPEPKIANPHDAIVKVTTSAICGSDLHLFDGYIPSVEVGDVLGHEFTGQVVDVGREVTNLKPGDRVVVPFPIACGQCFFCQRELYSLCDNTNPKAWMAETLYGYSPAGIYGYSHLVGGYAGGQAEYVRVPFANVGPLKLEDGLTDDQAVLLSDVFPTAYMAAENCDIHPGDTVAVFGCGPIGQLAIRSAFLLGAERVIAIDPLQYRLDMARERGGAETINYDEQPDVVEVLKEMTGGRGPDSVIDAVGMEAHGRGAMGIYDRAMQATRMESDRPGVLRLAIQAVRKGGTLSVPGVYGGMDNMIPLGALFNKGLTLRTGQTHVQKYLRPLRERIQRGEIDPSYIITHRLKLDQAPEGYRVFHDRQENCVKVVLNP